VASEERKEEQELRARIRRVGRERGRFTARLRAGAVRRDLFFGGAGAYWTGGVVVPPTPGAGLVVKMFGLGLLMAIGFGLGRGGFLVGTDTRGAGRRVVMPPPGVGRGNMAKSAKQKDGEEAED
jgi:hypothetical protein